MDCHYCQKEIIELPFKCRHCKAYFCPDHRLRENHFCEGSPSIFDEIIGWFSKVKDKLANFVSPPNDYVKPSTIFCGECHKDLKGEKKYVCSTCKSAYCKEHNSHKLNHELSKDHEELEATVISEEFENKPSKENQVIELEAPIKVVPKCATCKKHLGGFERPVFCTSCRKHYCRQHDKHEEKHGRNMRKEFQHHGKCTKCGIKLNILNKTVCTLCGQVFCKWHSREKKHSCNRKIRTTKVGFMTDHYEDGTQISDTSRRGYV